MTNISKRLALLVVVLLVTSISANMVAAVRVNDDTTPLEDGEFNQYPVDDPNAINETSYNMRLTPSRYTPLQSGETVIVTEGDNLDKYLFWPNTIEPDIPVQTNDSDIYSAEFTLSIYDVDEYCGSACNGVCEVDPVYFNGHYLGTLTGANDQWSTTTFILDPSWINGASGGSPGINHVKIVIDVDSQSCWAVECDWVQLIINAGAKGNARIVSLSTDKQAYSSSDPIDVAIDLTTDIDSQSVRLETNLYDIYGVNVDGSSTTHTLHKNEITSVTRQLSIPVNAPTGEYTIEAIVYDSASVQQDKKTVIVTVGTDPDFYVTPQDISFSQINTVPGGLEVKVDLSIHYENGNTPRDVDVNIYKADINTGIKTLVHSENVSMSPGINTLSKVLNLPSYQYRGCIVVDPDNKIKETNENNNEACKSLDGRPTIDDVKSEYIGTFLVGIPIMNRFDVFVDWGEGEPDKVIFELNGDTIEESATSGSPSASHEYDMGFDIRVWPEQNVLKITAINTDGGVSEPFILSPKVVPIPTWLGEYLGFEVIEEPHVIIYKKEVSFPEPPFKGIVTVPDWVPHVNGKLGVKDTQAKVDAEAKTDGSGSVELSGQTGFAAMQQEVLGGASGRGDIELDALHLIGATFKLFIQGVLKKEVGVVDAVPALKSAEGWPVVGHIVKWFNKRATIEGKISPRVDLQANFKEVNEQLEFVEGTGSGTLPMLLTLTLEAYEKLRASVYGGGTPSIDLQVPEKPPLGYLKKLSIRLLIGLEVRAWIFQETFENAIECVYPNGCSKEGTLKETCLVYTLSDNGGGMQVLGRDYAKTEYAVFAARDATRSLTSYSTAQTQETLIVSNVFPLAEPSIDAGYNIALLVWVHDDISKPIVQGEEIYYSLWDGTTWSVPSAITNDNNFDFSPTVKFNPDGDAIAIWERNKNESLDENITLDENFTSGFEIAYSVFNSTTSCWSNTSLLTNNSYLDFGPRLVSDKNNNVVAIWIANEQNILSTENSTLYYSIWNNTAFTSPSILKTDDTAIMRDFAYKDGKLIYVCTQDKDGNFSTAGDEEIYYAQWNGTWSVPIQITNDDYDDEVPSVLYDIYGNAKVLWLKRVKTNVSEFDEETNTTYNYTKYVNKLYQSERVGNSWTQESLVRNDTSIIDFEITSDADDNIVLVWVAMGINGSDMFYSVYDSNHSSWSTEYQLTSDLAMEETTTAVFDWNNTLVASYLKVEVLLTNRTIRVNESEMNITNAPEFGNSSLYVLRHDISKDLSITNTDILLSSNNPYPGDNVTINATVHNIGDLSIDSIKVAFFDDFDGPQVGATQVVDTIPAGANASVSVNWTVPLTEQSHEIYVKVDPLNEISETNEGNNIASVSTVLPDLVVNWTFASYLTSERQISVNTSIKNNGTISASDVTVGFNYGNYTDFNESASIKIGTKAFNNLTAGDSKEIGLVWDVSAINRSWYNIHVVIDANNTVQESDESNNEDTVLAKVLPDLTLNSSDIEYSSAIEGNISIFITVHNKGVYDAENITLSIYNGSLLVNSSIILANMTIPLIRALDSTTTAYEWSALPGMYDITVVIDPDNIVDELDESNNMASNPLIITPGADLMLHASDIIFSDVNELGQVTISAIIHNIGLADVPYTTVEYYNGTPDVNQTNPYVTNIPNSLGTEVVPFVSSEGFVMVNLCANWTPMENRVYDIYVKVDPKDNVHESNKSNNMAFNRYPYPSELYYPDFTDTDTPGNWRTWLGVMNTGDTATTLRLDVYNPDGSLAYSNPSFVTLEPKAAHFFRPGITAGIAQGSAIVYGDNLAGTCHVNKNGGEGTKVYTALSNASSTLYYPDFTDTDTIGNWRTWIAVMNTGDTSTTLNLAIYNTDGSVAYLNPNFVTLEPKAVHFFRPGITAGIAQGSVVISGDNLAGTCHVNKNGGEGTKVYPAVSGDSAEALDLAYKSSELKVFSRSRTTALARAPVTAELTRFEPITFPARVAYDNSAPKKAFAVVDSGYDRFEIRPTPPRSPVDLETVKICLWPDWPDSEMFTTVSPAATEVTQPPKRVRILSYTLNETENEHRLSKPTRQRVVLGDPTTSDVTLQSSLDTQTITIDNVSNSFPMFSNAEYVNFTIDDDTITLILDVNASFDGVCNLSTLMGREVSVAGSTAGLNYTPISYQTGNYDQKWASDPYFNVTEHKLYLLSGSGLMSTLHLELRERSATAIPKVVGIGDLVCAMNITTTAEKTDARYNNLTSHMTGVGYADLYILYAPDVTYDTTPYLPVFTHCERLEAHNIASLMNGSGSSLDYNVSVIGLVVGAAPIARELDVCNLSLNFDLEYFPITYQGFSADQKWQLLPSVNETEHRLYLLSGSGIITTLNLTLNENSTTTPISKVVGVGDLVGNYHIEALAQGSNSSDNHLASRIVGVGYADLYAQYAPDTTYESTPFMPVFMQCEALEASTINSLVNGSGSSVEYQVEVLGRATGANPIPVVADTWNSSLDFDVEYFPITYQNVSYDQKWYFIPRVNESEHKLYLLSGSGMITTFNLTLNENSTTTPISKVVGVGALVGNFRIEALAQGANSRDNHLSSRIVGVGYADLYAQYAPDTSYENVTFIPTFSQCEHLQMSTNTAGAGVAYDAHVLGLANGVEYLEFNNIPLDSVAINGTFDLAYHSVNVSGDVFDEEWSFTPWQYNTILVLLRGTGNVTQLNFTFNDTTSAYPEITSYGYLSGDYDITTTILPHYMYVNVNGTNVTAMDESGQGGFGITFAPPPKIIYPDFTDTDTIGNWRTWLGVMNTGDTSATLCLDVYNTDGSVAYSNSDFVTLDPKAVHFFRPGMTAGIAQGSAIVYGNNLAGTCHVNKNGGEGTKVYTALSSGSSTLYYPDFTDTDTSGNWRTWMGVMNTGDTSTTLRLDVYNPDGSLAYSNTDFVTLGPKAVHFFRPGITAGIAQGDVVVSGDNLAGTCHVNKNGGEGTKVYTALGG